MSTTNSEYFNEKALNSLIGDYFLLVDQAAQSSEKLDQIVNLFSEKSFLTPAGGEPYVGKAAVRKQFTDFHEQVSRMSKHFYNIISNDGKQAKVDWAVSAKLNNGSLFTLQGFNIFTIGTDDKLKSIEVFDAPKA